MTPFMKIPVAEAWKARFLIPEHRYLVLLIYALSQTGKTELSVDLLPNGFAVALGVHGEFPFAYSNFDEEKNDCTIVDEARDTEQIEAKQDTPAGRARRAPLRLQQLRRVQRPHYCPHISGQ